MPLPDAYAIAFASPLFITALSVPVLGETVGWRRWCAVAVGFAGVLVILRPGSGVLGIGALCMLASSLCYSTSVLIIRRYGRHERGVAFAMYGTLVGFAVSASIVPFVFVVPSLHDMAIFAICGTTAGVAVVALFGALGSAPAAVVAPFQYTQMLWGVLSGYPVWGDLPDRSVLVGGGLVIASGLDILASTRRPAIERDITIP